MGLVQNERCFLPTFVSNDRRLEIIPFDTMEGDKKRIIEFRVGHSNLVDICGHHFSGLYYFHGSYRRVTNCVDPYRRHKKRINGTIEITLDFSDQISDKLGIRLVPGHKLCCNCYTNLLRREKEEVSTSDDEVVQLTEQVPPEKDTVITPEKYFNVNNFKCSGCDSCFNDCFNNDY